MSYSVNVIFPAFLVNRFELLKKTVDSVFNSTYKNVKISIGINGNKELLELVKQFPVDIYYADTNLDCAKMLNVLAAYNKSDMILYCCDDVMFAPDCIETAVGAMEQHFTDLDGLVSIKQVNVPDGWDTAFGLVGKKFISRFPEILLCPEYVHGGADAEVGDYAKYLGKHFHCEAACLFNDRIMDESQTYSNSVMRKIDVPLYYLRKEKGFLWGNNFDLVDPKYFISANDLKLCGTPVKLVADIV